MLTACASRPHSAGLPEYLASLRRINEALTGLKATNLRSNQEAIVDLKSLLGYGNRQVEDVFRKILSEDTRVIEPLHYITKSGSGRCLGDERGLTMS
jgi:exocyst complex protein 7